MSALLEQPGQFVFVGYYGGKVITNAALERVGKPYNYPEPRIVDVMAIGTESFYSSDEEVAKLLSGKRPRFAGFNYHTPESPKTGKFVCLKDGTFFLFDDHITHRDILGLVGVTDVVAVMSAGFTHIFPDEVILHGSSVSLDRGLRHDERDRKAISEHLGISFIQERARV